MFLKAGIAISGILFLVSLSSPAKADIYMNGAELTDLCLSEDAASQYVCESYIAGVIDYHHLVGTMSGSATVEFCIPDNTKLSKLREAVAAYLSVNRQHQDFAAAPAVALGLFEIYPCKE